jgi:hypothetical protein
MRFEGEVGVAFVQAFLAVGLRSVARGDWRDYFRLQEGRWGVSQLFAAAESSVAAMGRMSQVILLLLEGIDSLTDRFDCVEANVTCLRISSELFGR